MRLRLVLVCALAGAGCGWTPADRQIVERFFQLATLHDTTRLADVATVVFDPTIEGVVEQFEVLEWADGSRPGGGLSRTLRIRAQVRTPAGAPRERGLEVTLEGPEPTRLKVTGVRWVS